MQDKEAYTTMSGQNGSGGPSFYWEQEKEETKLPLFTGDGICTQEIQKNLLESVIVYDLVTNQYMKNKLYLSVLPKIIRKGAF
jgi:adenine-specific DNA methylase